MGNSKSCRSLDFELIKKCYRAFLQNSSGGETELSSELLELWKFWNSKFVGYLQSRVDFWILSWSKNVIRIFDRTLRWRYPKNLEFQNIQSSRSSDESSFPPPRFLPKIPMTFFDQLKILNLHDFELPKEFRVSKFSEFQEFWWKFCFCPPKSPIENPNDIFRSTQNPEIYKTEIPKKFRFQNFQNSRCSAESSISPEEICRKALQHFSINSKSKNLHDFEHTQKISNFKIFRVPGVLMRVMFLSRKFLQKYPIIFFDQLKIEKSTWLKVPKKFRISKFSVPDI